MPSSGRYAGTSLPASFGRSCGCSPGSVAGSGNAASATHSPAKDRPGKLPWPDPIPEADVPTRPLERCPPVSSELRGAGTWDRARRAALGAAGAAPPPPARSPAALGILRLLRPGPLQALLDHPRAIGEQVPPPARAAEGDKRARQPGEQQDREQHSVHRPGEGRSGRVPEVALVTRPEREGNAGPPREAEHALPWAARCSRT